MKSYEPIHSEYQYYTSYIYPVNVYRFHSVIEIKSFELISTFEVSTMKESHNTSYQAFSPFEVTIVHVKEFLEYTRVTQFCGSANISYKEV